jgi:hypothetical protein
VHLRPSERDPEVDRIVALPVLEGPAPSGLPADERCFIPTAGPGPPPSPEPEGLEIELPLEVNAP